MTIAISTGCCFDLDLNRLKSIHYLEKFKDLIDGTELIFAYKKELFGFKLDKKATAFLKSLSFVSIHMPFKDIEYKQNKETKKIMQKGIKLAKQVNAQYLLFHPTIIKNFQAIKSEIPICIENMPSKPKHKGNQNVKDMQKILKKHPLFGLVIDTGHTLSNKIPPKKFLVFKDKIKAFHVNARWLKKGKPKEHGFLTQAGKKQTRQIKQIMKHPAPKIIEVDFYPEKVHLIEKEIELIKKLEKR